MALRTFLVPLLLTAAVEICFSLKSDKIRCNEAGHIKIESPPEQQMDQDPCAMVSITSVHICEDGEWKTICGEKSTSTNREVLCRAKGFSSIGATISTTSQAIGSAISSFMLHCNGSETNPDDCVVESPSLVTTHCQRTIIQCFITDPDPQLCNISLSTTLPEYKTIVSDHTLASTANTEAPTDHILVRHTTADTMVAKRSHKDSSNLTIISSIAVVTVMIAVLTCFASLVMICFMVKRRKEASKTEKSKQEEKESQKLFDDTSQYAVITECKQERQKERVESVHQYKKNDAYGCMPIDMQTNHFNQQIGGVVMSDDQQQDVEPVYETIPDPIRLQTE